MFVRFFPQGIDIMKRHWQVVLFALVGCICITSTDRALGQGKDKKAPKGKINVVQTRVSGTIVSIEGNTIVAMNSRNEKWVIFTKTPQFNVTAKVTVEGRAVVEALRPGVYVRFTADVDRRGNVQGELTELEIYEPSPSSKPGIYPNGAAAGNAADDGAADDGAADDDAAGDSEDGKQPDVASFLVAGQIASFRKGKLTLAIPGSTGARGIVSADVRIRFRGEDHHVARPGDAISAKGFYRPRDKGTLNAQEIAITLTRVLGETAKSKKKRERLAQKNAGKQPGKKQEFSDLLKDGKTKAAAGGPKQGKQPAAATANDDEKPLILIIN